MRCFSVNFTPAISGGLDQPLGLRACPPANLSATTRTFLFCSTCLYEGDIVVSNKRVNKHLGSSMPIFYLFTLVINRVNLRAAAQFIK